MKVKGNPLFLGASGKLGNIIVKQYTSGPIVTAIPDMSCRKLSEKQKKANENMRLAIKSAKHICKDRKAKEKACTALNVPPNKVFRAIVKYQLLNDMDAAFLKPTEQQKKESGVLNTIKSVITADMPDAEITLYGDRARAIDAASDWDLLVLTDTEYQGTSKWKLQEKLFAVTIQSGFRVSLLIVLRNEWNTNPNYELLKKRIDAGMIV